MSEYGTPIPFPGGFLTPIDAERIHARADNGRQYILHRLGHDNANWRNAENWLLKYAGLSLKPKCCATCGVEVVKRKDCYCSEICRVGRKGRLSPAEVAYESLTPEMIRASLDASLAARSKGKRVGEDAEGGHDGHTNKWEVAMYADAHSFADALALADRLIRAKGGTVPTGFTRADVADAHERALARRAAKSLKATA